MTCQRIGRVPNGTIGFGTDSEYSRSRIPSPPQKITTFTRPPPAPARPSQTEWLRTRTSPASCSHPALQVGRDLLQVLPGGVFGRNEGDRQRPLQGQPRVERRESCLGAGRIEFAGLVARLRTVFERLVPVSESAGHVERAVIVRAQLHRDGLQKSGTLGAEVHDHVEDRSARGPDQLRFGMGRVLEMQAAHRALLLGVRDVDLRHLWLETVLGELPAAKGAREEAAVVLAPLQIQDERTLQLRLGKDHDRLVPGEWPSPSAVCNILVIALSWNPPSR